MKKLLLISLVIVMLLGLVSCGNQSSKNKFISLKDNEVLKIGQVTKPFMNYENETVTDKYVTYTNSVTYTLRRSYSSSATNSVYYNGYYYYWDTQSTSQEKKLGKQTITTVYSYQYLPYGENEEILVKSTVFTHTAFDYDGGWLDFSREVKTNLSNLFESFDDLEKKCPDLAKLIDTSTTQKIFVDIVVPDVTTSQETYYSTYYYIEEK